MVGQEAEIAPRQNQRRDRFLVGRGRAARELRAMAELHVRRMEAEPGERVVADRRPGQLAVRRIEQRMLTAAVQQHPFVEQFRIDEAARAAVGGDDPDLITAVDDPAFDLVDRRDVQVQRDVGRLVRELADRVAEPRVRIRRGLVEHRDVQFAAHPVVNAVDPAAKRLHRREQPQRLLVDGLAFGRQREAGAAPPAQHEPEPRLEILHVPADRRDADIQFQFGRRHSAALDDALEDPQQPQIHVAELPEQRAALRFLCLHSCASEH
ncbi:hypothetical protein FEP35_00001 [Burkholderia multivorans]|nr:hypothetical protein [Burkholderia multivorans]